jgi:hypothetical protein
MSLANSDRTVCPGQISYTPRTPLGLMNLALARVLAARLGLLRRNPFRKNPDC